MSDPDQRYMRMALSLGRRGMGTTWPNPAVGCVIVANDRIVGRGFTQPGGRPHAERVALDQAGNSARGATAYVTLEPCAHHGQTPPCAEALISAGLARVVIAHEDPDPRVAGRGIAKLRAAGIDVDLGTAATDAAQDHRGFLMRLRLGRPRLTLKLAQSFDGRIALASGESKWITGPLARRHVHGQRARHDAVMVGANTARVDNPSLTVRGLGVAHQPVRIVVSRDCNLPFDGELARTARDVPVWICHGSDANAEMIARWQDIGVRCIPIDVKTGAVAPSALMHALGDAGLTSVFCEGGAALAASLLHARMVDDLIGYTAGLTIGAEGRPSIASLGLDQLQDAQRFALIETRALGADVMHHWRRRD